MFCRTFYGTDEDIIFVFRDRERLKEEFGHEDHEEEEEGNDSLGNT